MYKKETADKKHHTNPYRAVNYIRDENGNPICPNGRKFLFKRKQHVRYKKYGRTEEIYPSLLSVPFLHKTVTIFKKHILKIKYFFISFSVNLLNIFMVFIYYW